MIILSLPHKSGETMNILRSDTEEGIMQMVAQQSIILSAEGEMKWKEDSPLKDFVHPSAMAKAELPFLTVAPTLEEFEKHYLEQAKEAFNNLFEIPENLNGV